MHQTAKPRKTTRRKGTSKTKPLRSGSALLEVECARLAITVTERSDGKYSGSHDLRWDKSLDLKNSQAEKHGLADAEAAVEIALVDALKTAEGELIKIRDPAWRGRSKAVAIATAEGMAELINDITDAEMVDRLNWEGISEETPPAEKPTTKDTKSTKEDSSVVSVPSVVENKSVMAPEADPDDGLRLIQLEDLVDHPGNPDPTEQEITDMMQWLIDENQQEPLTVRPLALARTFDKHEVLAGKTRLAAARRLGWEKIECRVRRDLTDDAEAARFAMKNNLMRRKENPLRKVRWASHFVEQGLGNVKQAGEVYGWSESYTRSMLGLLKLPSEWIARIESGELPPTAAVRLIPFVDAPPIMADLDKTWKGGGYWRDAIADKSRIALAIERAVDAATRPIEPKAKRNYGYQYMVYYDSHHPRYFDLAEDDETKLQIVKLPLGKNGKLERVALNVKEYDKRQIPLIKKLIAEAKKGGKSKGKAKGKKASELTPAEAKKEAARKRKQADETLAHKLIEWKHHMLRLGCAEAIMALPLGDERTSTLLPIAIASTSSLCFGAGQFPIAEYIRAACLLSGSTEPPAAEAGKIDNTWLAVHRLLADVWPSIMADEDQISRAEGFHRWLVYLLLWPRIPETIELRLAAEGGCSISHDLPWGTKLPGWEFESIDLLAELLGVKLPDLWKGATAMASPSKPSQRREMLRVFLELHTRDQLNDLAAEVAVSATRWVSEQKTKAAAVDALMDLHKKAAPLKLPASLAPPAKATKAKRKKGK